MFIIDLHYIAPLEKIDERMGEHMKFLNQCYKENIFVASGRKVPRTGGIILAMGKSKEEIESIIKQDPFVERKLAEYSITEFTISQSHPKIKKALTEWLGL